MNSKDYRMNDSLATLYDEIRNELCFELTLTDLMEGAAVWETDIVRSLKQAYLHLFRAYSRMLDETERTGQLLLAELYIRDLVEHLMGEVSPCSTQISAAAPTGEAGLSSGNLQHDSFESTISTAFDDHEEEGYCRFHRNGADIDVIVDHDSDTNFFADISYDLHRGGLFVATYNILEVGTRLKLRLVLPGKHTFFLQGRVSWVRESLNCADDVSPGMGISFEKLSREPSRAIRRFMTERQPLLFDVA